MHVKYLQQLSSPLLSQSHISILLWFSCSLLCTFCIHYTFEYIVIQFSSCLVYRSQPRTRIFLFFRNLTQREGEQSFTRSQLSSVQLTRAQCHVCGHVRIRPTHSAAGIDSRWSYNFKKLYVSSRLELTRQRAETFQGVRLHIFVGTLAHKNRQIYFRTSLAP